MSRADGKYAVTASQVLAGYAGRGEMAAELLGRQGDRDSLRVAALLMRETARVVRGENSI